MSAMRLPAPTICDINCFKPPGHDGPHQKWEGDECDVCGWGYAMYRTPRGAECRRCVVASAAGVADEANPHDTPTHAQTEETR